MKTIVQKILGLSPSSRQKGIIICEILGDYTKCEEAKISQPLSLDIVLIYRTMFAHQTTNMSLELVFPSFASDSSPGQLFSFTVN